MNKLFVTMLSLVLLGMFSAVVAGEPPPPSAKNVSLIAHCGCDSTGDDLEWTFVDVGNGRGHNNHRIEDIEVCSDESGTENQICERDYEDCVLAGEIPSTKGKQSALQLCLDNYGGGEANEEFPVSGNSCSAGCIDFFD